MAWEVVGDVHSSKRWLFLLLSSFPLPQSGHFVEQSNIYLCSNHLSRKCDRNFWASSDKLPSPLTVFLHPFSIRFQSFTEFGGKLFLPKPSLSSDERFGRRRTGRKRIKKFSSCSWPAFVLPVRVACHWLQLGATDLHVSTMAAPLLPLCEFKADKFKAEGLSLACTWQPCTPATQIKLCHFVEHKP